MQDKIDINKLFEEMQAGTEHALILPPPSFSLMQCEVLDYNEVEKSLVLKVPVSHEWVNPYNTMQGGLINAAIDNAVGPLSLLCAPANITRSMETKFIKAVTLETLYIYVYAKLLEQKKKRLTFEVTVQDQEGSLFVKSKVVNFIL